jgi:hypothetical protein
MQGCIVPRYLTDSGLLVADTSHAQVLARAVKVLAASR